MTVTSTRVVWVGAAVDTTIVRLLCVRTVSLSGHILDRSYYIHIISTKPTSTLYRHHQHYTSTLSTSPLHFPTVNTATMETTTTTTTMTMNATIPFITIIYTYYIYHQPPHPWYLPCFEQCSAIVLSLYHSIYIYIYTRQHSCTVRMENHCCAIVDQ